MFFDIKHEITKLSVYNEKTRDRNTQYLYTYHTRQRCPETVVTYYNFDRVRSKNRLKY